MTKGDQSIEAGLRGEPEKFVPVKVETRVSASKGSVTVDVKSIGGELSVDIPIKAPVSFGFDGEDLKLLVIRRSPIDAHLIAAYRDDRIAYYSFAHDKWEVFDPDETIAEIRETFPESRILYDIEQ